MEQLIGDWCTATPTTSAVLLRYSNPVGAHHSGLIGEDPRGEPNNLMPYVAQVAIGQRERLRVFGNDYPTPDGTGVRDYLHMVDLAQAHLLALDYATTRPGCEAFNLGTGRGYSVLEVVRAFEAASGKAIPYDILPRRAAKAMWPNSPPIPVARTTCCNGMRSMGWRRCAGMRGGGRRRHEKKGI